MRVFLARINPPLCAIPRLMVAWCTLAVGIPRLPIFSDTQFAPLKFVSPEVYGIIMTLIGVAILITVYHKRTEVTGRVVAAVGFVTWVMLTVATTSSTSFIIDIGICAILIGEIRGKRRCYED